MAIGEAEAEAEKGGFAYADNLALAIAKGGCVFGWAGPRQCGWQR